MILSGLGKVSLYNKGELLLKWPNKEKRTWWISDLSEEPWLKRDNLIEILRLINKKFKGKLKNKKYYEIIADALYWISEQPGYGCSLVIAKNIEHVKARSIPLNPAKLKWVDKIPLVSASKDHIQNSLVQDGATILDICHDEPYLESQQLIAPIKDGKLYSPYVESQQSIPPIKNGKLYSPSQNNSIEKRWSYGTRHTSACDLTHVLKPDCFVVTVSADGPITVFYKGESLTKDCNNWQEFAQELH